MAVDVMRNPPTAASVVQWYRPAHTTPFALTGHIGPVLASLNADKYGSGAREVWFGDNGWEMPDGTPIDDDDVLLFGLMPSVPEVPA